MRFTTKLFPSRSGNIVQIQLNNLKAFHALDLDMIRCFDDSLSAWDLEDSIKGLFVTSCSEESKERGKKKRHIFSAGGDVKSIYQAGLGLNDNQEDINAYKQSQHGFGSPGLTTADFFREEYQLNYKLATAKESRPQISLWDGIVFGGGVGITIHGKYRIATENCLFAMPETAIGLFPDVGSTYWLPRVKNSKMKDAGSGIGRYIALTGARLKADDLMYTGIATHYVPSIQLEDLKQAIISNYYIPTEDEGSRNIDQILLSFHEPIINNGLDSFLAKHKEEIDATFSKDTVEDIIIALEHLGTDFATDTLNTLQKMSPTSLKVTLEGLKQGLALPNVGECLRMEYRMAQRFMQKESDFYEGIRAVLIDKDNSPRWSPNSLEQVSDEFVESFFQSLGENDLHFDTSTSTIPTSHL